MRSVVGNEQRGKKIQDLHEYVFPASHVRGRQCHLSITCWDFSHSQIRNIYSVSFEIWNSLDTNRRYITRTSW